ncbi:hypothetical protein SEA_SPARCETUS_20 [Microbacterium phage Sparcetus]|nr:hypothetical protein SEA_SPARCETUS_20 [Microbacterium phage Sparcetus]
MARKIDFSQPLSADEQQYVLDRPWLIQDAILRGEEILTDDSFSVEEEDQGEEGSSNQSQDTNGEGASDATGDEGSADDSSEEDEDDAEESEDDGSEEESEEDNSEDDSEEDEAEEVAPYDEWDYQELKDEAKRRDLSAGGSKEQLIKRLQDNDAEEG